MTGVIDAILIDDQRIDQTAELEERVPISSVAGEPRCLDRNHGAHASLANCSQQLLEAWPCDPRAGAAEIIIDYLDGAPSESASTIGERILASTALMIVVDLIGRRLAHINERTPS